MAKIVLVLLVGLGLSGCSVFDYSTGIAGASCLESSQCDDGLVCLAGHCLAAGSSAEGDLCWATRDCADGLYCSPLGECAPGGDRVEGEACGSDAQCEPDLRCELSGLSGTCAATGTGEPGSSCEEHADCLAGLWCSPTDMTCEPLVIAYPPFAGATCEDEGDFRAYFEVPRASQPPKDFFRLPFPNDVRVSASGELDLSDFPRPGTSLLGIDVVGLYVDAWTADFEGFAATAPVTFRFAGELSFDSVQAATVSYVDVTPGAPEAGQSAGALSWAYSTGRNQYACQSRLQVQSTRDEPLKPGHTYAVFLHGAITNAAGTTAVADADLASVLAGTRPASDAALQRAWDVYAPLREHLSLTSIDPSTVRAATLFTVQDTTGHMQRLAAATAAQPAPVLKDLVLCDAGVTSPCADGSPARVCGAANGNFYELHGRFSVPIFQRGTAPYLTPADGGDIVETGGVPQLARTEDVCLVLTVPKSAMPASGWPLTVYHHGTGGSMRSFVGDGIAQALATSASPSAVLGFDAVNHGARRGTSMLKPDDLVFNPLNPHAARDNFLQGAVDVLQAFRVAGVTLDAGASPTGAEVRFDATKVVYFGHSQGSTSGELALAFTNATGAAVLSGAGANLTASLLDKTSPVNVAGGMSLLVGDKLDGGHPVMVLFQSYFERSDPLNYLPLLYRRPPEGVSSKHVYMSWGPQDTYTPTSTLKANARGLGVPPVMPVLEDYKKTAITRPVSANAKAGDARQVTAACFQYAPDGYDGHFVASRNPAAVTDWTAFISSYLSTGTPSIP